LIDFIICTIDNEYVAYWFCVETIRQKDAGVNVDFPEVFTVDLDATRLNDNLMVSEKEWRLFEN